MVIWFIGLSGSGKTTLGNRLKEYLDRNGKDSYLIDGDLVRGFFENDLGYTPAERKANIRRIQLAAHVLSESGTIGIVCNISPFEELREFARRRISGYTEIYLKRDIAELQARDSKGMYRENLGKTDIVGLDTGFDPPLHSDIVLDTANESVSESFERVLEYLKTKYPETFN